MSQFLRILLLAQGLALSALPSTAAEEPLAVTAITAELTNPQTMYVLVGEITAPETLQAAFPLGGRLTDVRVQVGDTVKAGDELARIEQVQQIQALASAEAKVSAALAEHVAAKFQSDRQAELFDRGATTRSDRDAAADRLAAADATKSQAEATLDQVRRALKDTVLIAPADATVTDRFGEPGQVVGAAQPVLELAIGPGFEAKFDVPETVLTSSARGPGVVQLSAIDRPSITVTGRVDEVSPLVDPARGTIEVTVVLDAPVPGLTYGDAVRGSTTAMDTARIALPWSAMSSNSVGPTVWVIDPATNMVSERPITLDRYSEGQVLVADGLAPGDLIVTHGAHLLYPGRPVRIVETRP